jgi:dihydroxy-acid dehydratase
LEACFLLDRGLYGDYANVLEGCDKTTPAQLMGGISANKPIVQLVTGPMMPGSHKGTRVGACTDCRNNWAKYRAGTIDIEEISAINEELAPTVRRFQCSAHHGHD